MARTTLHLALALAAVAGCASTRSQPLTPDARASADPWLRSRTDANCAQASCLFAIVVDTARNLLAGADVELSGTPVHETSNNQGRVVAQGISLGSHRIRVLANGETLESEPIAFGYLLQALTIEVGAGRVRIVR